MQKEYYNFFYGDNREGDYSFDNFPTLQIGDENDFVRQLQEYLIELGFLRGIPNGIFGINTQRAVELFQLTYNLPVTGVVDTYFWKELEEAMNNPLPTTRPTLRLGDQNTSVKSLQLRLVVLGYLNQVSPEGLFDENTEAAVISFQTDRGLTPDGIAGPNTWREIDQSFSAVAVNIPTIKPDVEQGDQNEYVRLLQEILTALGYFKGNVDGNFGVNTRNAVMRLQHTYGLEPTGIVDYFTWEVLDSLIRPTHIFTPILKEGSTVPEVIILQEKLKVAGFFSGTVTGSFGPETTLALQEFQEANGLLSTGITDRQTWTVLFQQTAINYEELVSPILVANKPTLRYGDQGEYVKELQRDLKQLMFFTDEIDGNFGTKTLESVKAFQTNNKLTADGIVGRNTWSALVYLYSPLAICGPITPPPTPPTGNFKGVVVDAGHGGTDPGAVSNAIIEKEYTLKISQYMANRFRELGVPFAMTRDTDETLSNSERIARMKAPFGDVTNAIVISNHINAGGGIGKSVITKNINLYNT